MYDVAFPESSAVCAFDFMHHSAWDLERESENKIEYFVAENSNSETSTAMYLWIKARGAYVIEFKL